MSHKIGSRNDPENQFQWNKGLIVRILLLTFFLKDPVHIMCNFTHSVLFYIHFWAASKVLVGIRYWFPSAVQHFATVFKHFLCSVSTFLPSLIIFQPFPHCISTFPPLYSQQFLQRKLAFRKWWQLSQRKWRLSLSTKIKFKWIFHSHHQATSR